MLTLEKFETMEENIINCTDLEKLIIELVSNRKFRPLDTKLPFSIYFRKQEGYFVVDGSFKIANRNIPMDNLQARINEKVIVTFTNLEQFMFNKYHKN